MSGNNYQSELDAFAKRQRRVGAVGWAAIAAVVVLLYLAFVSGAGETMEVEGVVVDVNARSNRQGEQMYLVVQLPGGEKVSVQVERTVPYREGDTAKLLKQTSLWLGPVSYRFTGYVGPSAQQVGQDGIPGSSSR